ncbi:MAG: alpha/beta hydrolase [Simkaniaceae bacterium]
MPIHPKLQEIIDQTNASHLPPQSEIPIEKARESFYKLRLLAGDPQPVAKILNQAIPGPSGNILTRIYYPNEEENQPVLVYFHPGGFVKGDIESHDIICRDICNAAECAVMSVNYRLAPENKFPAQMEDGYAALNYLQSNAREIHCDKNRIAVGGESSGANLAAVLTHFVKEKGGPQIIFQVLIYPQTDYTRQFPSHKEFAKGYLLEEESLIWYANQYLPESADPRNPKISPLWAEDFSNLPPAFIITAEYDPLRDEGEAYAQKLKEAGIKVIHHRYEGMTHGFFQMGGILDAANRAMEEVGEALKLAFGIR